MADCNIVTIVLLNLVDIPSSAFSGHRVSVGISKEAGGCAALSSPLWDQ